MSLFVVLFRVTKDIKDVVEQMVVVGRYSAELPCHTSVIIYIYIH